MAPVGQKITNYSRLLTAAPSPAVIQCQIEVISQAIVRFASTIPGDRKRILGDAAKRPGGTMGWSRKHGTGRNMSIQATASLVKGATAQAAPTLALTVTRTDSARDDVRTSVARPFNKPGEPKKPNHVPVDPQCPLKGNQFFPHT
jgi:hypothetical protein